MQDQLQYLYLLYKALKVLDSDKVRYAYIQDELERKTLVTEINELLNSENETEEVLTKPEQEPEVKEIKVVRLPVLP